MRHNNLNTITLLIICLAFSGCSFSYSSEAISTSISSPSKSSSSSQGEETVKKTSSSFNEEVTALTILYVGSSGPTVDFQRELGQIANSHGISDWESTANTYKAIGDGLKRAKVSDKTIEVLPFLQGLKGSPHYSQVTAYSK